MTTDLDRAAETFLAERPRLFGIAYRMLGSAAEAEDIVQEAWLRWQAYDRSVVQDARAFLTTTTTRLAINAAQSARARRETYVGPWLPEPVDTSADPALGAERGEALELAVLLLLERLSPTERAAYVLREAFAYSYQQIAPILHLSEAATRQLVSRGRKRLEGGQRTTVHADQHRRLLGAFLNAAQTGDLAALERLLAKDVVSITDGGGRVTAARIPVIGRDRVARFVASFVTGFWVGVEVRWITVNGQPGVLVVRDGAAHALLSLSASASGVRQLLWVMNPNKLAAFSHLATGD